MDSNIWITVLNFLTIMGLMVALWVLSLVKRNAAIVDIFWGLGFVVVAWLTFYSAQGYLLRRSLLVVMTTLWGVRLAAHIAVRSMGKGEDRRYKAWRESHGKSFWWVSLFKIFLLQGLLLWVISLPIQAGQLSRLPDRFTSLDLLGFTVWLTGFLFEALADWQLAGFQSDPGNKGKVLDSGLWSLTRHPNYFGECMLWWGIFAVALSNPWNAWTVLSPLVLTLLLLKVSGVALMEKSIVETRPGYGVYMKTTSAFLPRFRKS